MKKLFVLLLCIICSHGFSQSSVFSTIPGGDLYKLDIPNCSSQFVGVTGQGFGDITFTPDGRLWGIVSGDLYLIDTTTGASTFVVSTNVQGNSLVALNDSILLTTDGMADLIGINNITGSSYIIGNVAYGSCGDLSWYDNELYMTDCNLLVRIILNSTNTAVISATAVNTMANPLPGSPGLVTIPVPGDNNRLIGLTTAGEAVYICQIDGSHQVVCPLILLNGSPGAACMRLPIQFPEPVVCNLTSVVSAQQEISFNISPNPVSKTGTLHIEMNYAASPVTVTLMNLQGIKLFAETQQATNSSFEIGLEKLDLPAGAYMVVADYASGQQHSLIIIE